MRLRQGGFLIAKIHQASGRIFARILKDNRIDFNPAQGRILFALWNGDRIPIQELANRTQLGKSTLTSMLDRLQQSGHIRRVSSPDDRRVVLIELTDKDMKRREQYLKVSREMIELFYGGFSPKEIEEFEGYLERILANITCADS